MKTVQVKKTDGSLASFNFEHVVSIEPDRVRPLECCVITFITGQGWQVKEEYSYLMSRITGHLAKYYDQEGIESIQKEIYEAAQKYGNKAKE